MGKKLYVGNLPFSVNDAALQSLFGQVGAVDSAKVIIDNFSGRSKGFGFVEMANDEEALQAISKLNGTDMDGRAIIVNEARPMEPRSNSGGGFGGPRRSGGGFGGDRGGRSGGGFGGGRGGHRH
jgi:RNA recognition motif-containing protein